MVNSGERSDHQRGRSGNRSTNNTSDNTTKKNTNKSGPRGTSQNAVEGAARNGSNVVIADNRNREHEGIGNTNSHQTNIHKTSFNQRANNQNNNRNSDNARINSNKFTKHGELGKSNDNRANNSKMDGADYQRIVCDVLSNCVKGPMELSSVEKKTMRTLFPDTFASFKFLDEETIMKCDLLYCCVTKMGLKDLAKMSGKSKEIKTMLQHQAAMKRTELMGTVRDEHQGKHEHICG